jgi:hypothetical protein
MATIDDTQYILVLHRIGPTTHFGPFNSVYTAEQYNLRELGGRATINLLYANVEQANRLERLLNDDNEA